MSGWDVLDVSGVVTLFVAVASQQSTSSFY